MRPLLVALILGSAAAWGQTPVNKTVPVSSGQTVRLYFDYPELVRVTTWDKPEVAITGTVRINGGENDDAFVLASAVTGSTISIKSEIRDFKNLPRRISIERNGEKIVFKDRAAFRAYCAEHGDDYRWQNDGVDLDIELTVRVPRGVATTVESVYGLVEVQNFAGPLQVDAPYGGVDATVAENGLGELVAETNFGQIYSNLNAFLKGSAEGDFHTQVAAKLGAGPRQVFESKYGNVYLRKSN
jgi:hypothetical protein